MCHMPFGIGPRDCIGRRLSLLETKIAIIELLKLYTFIRVPETEVSINYKLCDRNCSHANRAI